ncbi:MAG: NADH:flavin oxidoreductase [Shewanella sp.]|nr:NADH:flavin oxidoreductase [Shewanella sp.]
MFNGQKIQKHRIENRFAVAPMTRVSATDDGKATDEMRSYYQRFAKGGFGIVITEGLYTDSAYSQGYKFQPGLIDASQANSWHNIIEDAHSENTLIVAQLMHAGALSQHNPYIDGSIAPSPVQPKGEQMPFYYGEGPYQVPQEITEQQIEEVISGFANAAVLAKKTGFDGVEIHGANGYLLDQFLTHYTNQRQDSYGGITQNRLRIHTEIIKRIRASVGEDFIVGIRLSQAKVNDTAYKWDGEQEACEVFTHLDALAIDYFHLTEPNALDGAFEGSLPLFQLAKKHTNKPVMINGELGHKSGAEKAIELGADFVAIGKVALSNPDFVSLIRNGQPLKAFSFDLLMPIANIDNQLRYEAKLASQVD